MLNKPGTRVEFHIAGKETRSLVAALSDVGAIPREGELISIRKETWRVVRVTWCVDHADEIGETALRANVEVSREGTPHD
jgi:hypothetical protein